MTQTFFIRSTVCGMVLAGALLLTLPVRWFPSFYTVRAMGIVAELFALLILIPPWIFRARSDKDRQAINILQLSLAACFIMSGLGELGMWQLYRYGFEYDKVVHFAAPLIMTLAFTYFLIVHRRVSFRSALMSSSAFVLFLGLAWEGVEYYSDKLFGTKLFGVYGQFATADTIFDILGDVLGILVGIITLVKNRSHWFFASR